MAKAKDKMLLFIIIIATAVALFGETPNYVSASSYTNAGFETGDFTGWTMTVPPGGLAQVVTSHIGYSLTKYWPVEGNYFARLKPDGPGSYTTLRQPIYIVAGEGIAGWAAFDGGDPNYNDNAAVRILNSDGDLLATPWYSDISIVGPSGDGPWTTWNWTASTSDTYTLEYRVANAVDSRFDSYALFDTKFYIPNQGFETGDLTCWGVNVPPGGLAQVVSSHIGYQLTRYRPVEGNYFARLKPNGPGSYTTLSKSIYVAVGQLLDGWAAFDGGDPIYNDNAAVRILNSSGDLIATPWYSDILIVGPSGDGPWQNWNWIAPTSDTYTLEYRVSNAVDSRFDSYALFDAILGLPPNIPPKANAGGPYVADEGTPILFNASESYDLDCNVFLQYRWDFENDGIWDTPYSTDPTATYTWSDDWMGTAMVEVSDGIDTDTSIASVTIHNIPPTVEINTTVDEDLIIMPVTISFNARVYDPGSDDLTFTWDWGDGTPSMVTFYPNTDLPTYPVEIRETVEYHYAEPGVFPVTLTVTDDDGGIGSDTLTITVLGPRDLKEAALADLESIDVDCKYIEKKINCIIKHLEFSLNEKYWDDKTHLNSRYGILVFWHEYCAVRSLERLIKMANNKIPGLERKIKFWQAKGHDTTCLELELQYLNAIIPICESAIVKLVEADEIITKVILSDAEKTPVKNPKFQKKVDRELVKADKYLMKAMEKAENGEYSKAIFYYTLSWKYSQRAIKWANKETKNCWKQQ
ncbi:MAG: PKD domain-containing protein [Candidatus Hodarchaeota archaeon]